MAFRVKKNRRSRGHSASHTHHTSVQTRDKRSRNTRVPPHATLPAQSVIWVCCWPRTACRQRLLPCSSAQTTKVACSHETLHLEATLLESQVSKFNSVTQTRHQHAMHARTSSLVHSSIEEHVERGVLGGSANVSMRKML